MKCTYLEKLYPGKDFIVMNFSQSLGLGFSACYIKGTNPTTGAQTFALWNTVATNAWYEKWCGGDTDYYTDSKYSVVSKEG